MSLVLNADLASRRVLSVQHPLAQLDARESASSHVPYPACDLSFVAARLLAPADRPSHVFRQIPPESIARLVPRSSLSNPFSEPFPQFTAAQRWSSPRQRWLRAAFRSRRSISAPWLVRRAAQFR